MSLGSVFREAVVAHGPVRRDTPDAPGDYEPWLRLMFPRHIGPLGARHHAIWRWAWAITPSATPLPFVGIWPRGGGKSTSAEAIASALGVRGARRYCLYVRGTQDRADDSVSNVAGMLESASVARYYPAHGDRHVGKHGNAKAWRRNRVWTAGGFVVDAIGLDVASRGVKLEDQRPDLIILDDIDERSDSPATTAKKLATIATSLLPAGASNAAVLAIQNLIRADGVFARLVDGRADFLARRILSGPFPAVDDLRTELRDEPETGTTRAVIVGGTPTWAGQDLAVCQQMVDRIGLSAFRTECQHEVHGSREGIALRVTPAHREVLEDADTARLVKLGQVFGGIDFGAWRFGFVLRAADEHGVVHQLAEWFSQRETLEVRAQGVHALCQAFAPGVTVRLWGDAANPQDIMELNAAFKRVGSALRVQAVRAEHKARAASVERINDHLDRMALRYRQDVAERSAEVLAAALEREAHTFRTWRLGWNAASEGVAMPGSRLWWELAHWEYPTPKEGLSQRQDPDDHTADGADLIAADRYALMSYWRAGREPEDPDETFSVFDPEILALDAERSRKLSKRKEKRRQVGRRLIHGDGY